jgi:ATP-binding cassette, subfamily B, bacterial
MRRMSETAKPGTRAPEQIEVDLSFRDQLRYWGRFLVFLRPYRSKMILAILMLLVGQPLAKISLFLTKYLTDDAVLASDKPTDDRLRLLWIYLGIQVALWLGGYILTKIGEVMRWFIESRVALDLKKHFYDHLHRLPLSFFQKRPVGEHMWRGTTEISWGGGIVYLIAMVPIKLVEILYDMFWAVLLMSLIDRRLALAVLLYMVPFTLAKTFLVNRLRRADFALRDRNQNEAAVLRDSLAGLRTVKSCGRRRRQLGQYIGRVIRTRRMEIRRWWINLSVEEGVIFPLQFAFDKAVWLYIAWEVIRGNLTIGDWLVLFAMVREFRVRTQYLIIFVQNIRLQLVSGQRLLQTLDVPPTIADAPDAARLSDLSGRIAFENVTFGYRTDTPVLKNVSFTLEPGTKAAFVGPSGAGKSTILSLLLRLHDPIDGRVTVDGQDMKAVALDTYLERVGVVPQATFLFTDTIAGNLRYGRLDATDDELRRAAEAADIAAFIAALPHGYETVLTAGTHLSGGQKQRLGIARALVRGPRVLILDEATANLDPHAEAAVLSTLRRAGAGRTVVSVAHRLRAIADADIIFVLHDGEIVDRGTHAELVSRPGLYRDMWAEQNRTSPPPPPSLALQERGELTREELSRVVSLSVPAPNSCNPVNSPLSCSAGEGGGGGEVEKALTERAALAGRPDQLGPWQILRTVLGFLRPYRAQVGLLALAGIIGTTLENLSPWLLKPLMDVAFPNRDWGLVVRICAVIIALELFQRLFGVLANVQSMYVGNRLRVDLKLRFHRHLQRLSMLYIEGRPVGEHMYRNSADVEAVVRMIADFVPQLIGTVYTFFLVLAFTTAIDPLVALFVLAYIGPFGYGMWQFTSLQREIDREKRHREERANARMQEGIAGVGTVKTLGRRQHEVRLYTGRIVDVYRMDVRRYWLTSLQDLLLGKTLPFFKDKIIWAYFARKVILGETTMGMFLPLVTFAGRLAKPIEDLIEFVNQTRQDLIPAERLLQTLAAAPAVVERPDARRAGRLSGRVRFEEVSFAYEPDRPVLRGLDFAVAPGQRIAVVGASGAGKSTVVSLLLRLYDPTSGRVTIDGQDLRGLRLDSYQRQIGLVMQETYLFGGTVEDNLRLMNPDATPEQIADAARRAGIHDWIIAQSDGYRTNLSEGSALSLGQKQRLGIARALLADPALFLLDEPTASLDARTEAQIMTTLRDATRGRTTFLVTHRLHTVTDADEIWVMEAGRIVQRGTHDSLCAAPGPYRALWRLYHALDEDGGPQRTDTPDAERSKEPVA